MIGLIVTTQGDVFLISMIYGAALSLIYDMIRSFRRVVSHSNFVIAVEDFLYWIFWACAIISMIYTYNNGDLRSYVILGLILGACLYYLLFSRLILFLLTFILKKISRFLHFILSILIKPVKILSKR